MPSYLFYFKCDCPDAFCNGASNCTITGKLEIDYKSGGGRLPITDLSPLSCVIAVTSDLKIKECDITNLNGLGNIASVGGSLKFEDNPSLPNLDGLGAIGAVGGELKVSGNDLLTSISGLSVVTSVSSNLKKENNAVLTNLDGLGVSGAIGGELKITGNSLLTSVSGISGITSVSDNLLIENNAVLTNLNGLGVSGNVGGELKIKGNPLLASLSGLSGITSVTGALKIDDNPVLATLNGLQGISTVGGKLEIKNNTTLGNTGESNCISIPAGICTAVNNGIGGNISYSGNHSNCNLSEAEVEAACLAALPVELIRFTAKEDNRQQVVLSWATASESNNMHFVVERAADGRSFEALETVNGNGTTTIEQDYSYTDTRPILFAYYRLKQVDYDGAFEYSNTIFWELKKTQDDKIVVSPTLAKNEINLRFNTLETKKSLLKIVSSYGRVMHDEVVCSSEALEYRKLDLTNFENGVYYIILSDGFNNFTTKFIVAKTY